MYTVKDFKNATSRIFCRLSPFSAFYQKLPILSAKNRNNFETRKFPYYTSYSIHVITLKIADAEEKKIAFRRERHRKTSELPLPDTDNTTS